MDGSSQGHVGYSSDGVNGMALSLDGDGDYVDVNGVVVENDPDTSYSTSAWFKVDAIPAGGTRYMVYETSPSFTISRTN